MNQTKFRKICCLILSLILTANIANCLSLTSYAAEGVDVVEDTEIRESYTNTKALEEIVDLEEFEEYLATGIYNCDEYINVSHFNLPYNDESKALVSHFIYKEMTRNFHFNSLSYYYSDGILTKIKPIYTYTSSEYKSMMSEIEESADKLLDGIQGNTYLNEFEKALLIHDRLALLCEYDYTGTTNRYDIYGALVNGKAVCEGYAQAYDFLLEIVGIESYYCSSKLLNHAWNIIFIDGVPYHVDVTWDDYAWASGEHGVIGRIKHDNFLRSSDGIYATGHDKTDYETFPDDTRYDNHPIQNSQTAVQLINNEIYYIDNSSQQIKRLSDQKVLYNISDRWYAPTGGYWTSNYACLSSDNNSLFYSLSNAVYKYDISTQTATAILEPTLEQYFYIYGFEYKDGYLVCQINNGPPYSSYGITNLYTITTPCDAAKPSVSISCTNNVANKQTVTINMSDDTGIAGYYWGTNSNHTKNTYTATTSNRITKDVSASGTYYLTVKSKSGSFSDTQSITFYKTILNNQGFSVSPYFVITQSGNSFTFPSVTQNGYIYRGWASISSASSGQTSLQPTNDTTYYLILEKIKLTNVEILSTPTKTTYTKGESLNTNGLQLKATYSDGSTQIITSGFFTSGFDTTTEGTKVITVSYQNFTVTFTVEVLHSHSYTYSIKKVPSCTETGTKTFTCDCGHSYTESIPATGHSYQTTTTKATLTMNGKLETKCSVCGNVSKSTVIYSPKTIKLSTATCTYNGKERTPSVTVKDSNGNVLVNGTDYKVSVPSGRKLPGIYKYTITFMGKYSGTKTLDFTILPKAPTTISATQTTSTITLNWSESAGATGYRVYQYSPSQGKYVQVASVKGVTSYKKTTNFKAGTEYSFKVKPYTKLADGTVLWGVASEAFVTATKCNAPSITSVVSPSKSKATVKWSNVDGETGYQLYYATSINGTYKKINSYGADVLTGTKTFSASASGKTIYFKVRAYHKVNGQTIFGNWSAIKSVTLK